MRVSGAAANMRGWRGNMQISVLRVCAGCSILALAVLSWLPAHDMVRSEVLLPSEEHFLAYMLSGLLVAAAMPRYRFIHVACFYVLLATMLELGQNFVARPRGLHSFREHVRSDFRRGRRPPYQWDLAREGCSALATPTSPAWRALLPRGLALVAATPSTCCRRRAGKPSNVTSVSWT